MNPQLQAVLKQAIQAFQDGNLIKAEKILRQFSKITLQNFDAVHLLAVVYASQSKHHEAINCYKKAD
jgi:Tfp pilus assembly protein PilF